jgi:hypothetical protein
MGNVLGLATADGFVGQALAGAAFSLLVFGVPGWVALRGRLPWCAPAIGVCVAGPITLAFASLIGLGLVALVLGWVAALGVAFLWGRGEAWTRPGGWGLLGVAALGAIVINLGLVPLTQDGGLYVMPEMFDNSKLATIDAIAREGLPVRNPYYSLDGAAIPLNYYWGAYFCAALLRIGTGIGGWAAEMAMGWYVALAFLALSCGFARRWAGPRAAWWALALGMLSVPADFVGPGIGTDVLTVPAPALPEVAHVAPFFTQAPWVFQHVLGAVGAGVTLWALVRYVADELGGVRTGVLVGFGLATCAACSVQIAAATAVTAPIVLLAARGRGVLPAIGGALLALPLAWPVVSAMLLGRDAGGSAVVELRLFPASRLGLWWRPFDLPLFWIQLLPGRLGVAFVAGLVFLLRGRREVEWRMALAAVLGALLVVQFGKSVVLNNGLGWRATLPAMMLLGAAAAAWRARATSETARSLFLVGVVLGAGASLKHVSMLHERPWKAEDKVALARDFARQPEAWAAVRRHTAPSDLVANNPDGFARVGPWPANYGWSLFADRPAAIADFEVAWTNSLGQDPARREAALALVRAVFQDKVRSAQAAREARDRLRVKALLLDRIDPVWPGDAIESSGAWTAAEVTDHFKVYVPARR